MWEEINPVTDFLNSGHNLSPLDPLFNKNKNKNVKT